MQLDWKPPHLLLFSLLTPFVCLFSLSSTCPAFSSFNCFVNRFLSPLSLPLAQTSCGRWSLATQSLNPPPPHQLCPPGLPSLPPGCGPLPGPTGEGPPGDLGSLRPVSHCFLSFSGGDDVGPEACGKMGGGFRRKNPGLGGSRPSSWWDKTSQTPRSRGQVSVLYAMCPLGPDPNLGVKFGDDEARPLPHSPMEEAAT